jgi:hypothetical protein
MEGSSGNFYRIFSSFDAFMAEENCVFRQKKFYSKWPLSSMKIETLCWQWKIRWSDFWLAEKTWNQIEKEKSSTSLVLKIPRQLHSHKNPTHAKGHNDASESHCQPDSSVQFRDDGVVCLIENDETQTAESEQKAGSQSLHYVLAVDTPRHKGHRSGITILIGGAANARRFHDHVVNNSCNRNQKELRSSSKD